MATHSSILAWRIPWTEEPLVHGGLQRVGCDWVSEQSRPPWQVKESRRRVRSRSAGSADHRSKLSLAPRACSPAPFSGPWGASPNLLFSPRAPFVTDGTQHSHRAIFLGEVSLDLCQSHLSTDAWPKFFLLPTLERPSWVWVGQLKSCVEALLKQRKACRGRAWVRWWAVSWSRGSRQHPDPRCQLSGLCHLLLSYLTISLGNRMGNWHVIRSTVRSFAGKHL